MSSEKKKKPDDAEKWAEAVGLPPPDDQEDLQMVELAPKDATPTQKWRAAFGIPDGEED
jgi:hypothetical protein